MIQGLRVIYRSRTRGGRGQNKGKGVSPVTAEGEGGIIGHNYQRIGSRIASFVASAEVVVVVAVVVFVAVVLVALDNVLFTSIGRRIVVAHVRL